MGGPAQAAGDRQTVKWSDTVTIGHWFRLAVKTLPDIVPRLIE
jgi:hypothetical protein